MTGAGWLPFEDRASEAQILDHLARCDERFVPPLSGRVQLSAYAAKLHARARRFEAWSGDRLVGLVAVYFEPEQASAFVSNVSVEQDRLGQGVASGLLARAIAAAAIAGVVRIGLHVDAGNAAARALYEKLGFRACPGGGGQVLMQLDLPGTPP